MLKYRQQIKRLARVLVGKDKRWKVQCQSPKERLGSEFGGWDVITDVITKDSIIYSFGVGEDITFDLALMRQFKVVIHAFDPTPKSINWVLAQHLPDNFILHEYGLADFDGEVMFNPPKNPNHVSHTILDRPSTSNQAITVSVKKLETITENLGHDEIDILKMDIEGAEYQVIEDLVKSNIRPNQILVEFHHRFSNVGVKKTKTAVNQLNQIGYCLYSVSASGEEFCFVQNSLSTITNQ